MKTFVVASAGYDATKANKPFFLGVSLVVANTVESAEVKVQLQLAMKPGALIHTVVGLELKGIESRSINYVEWPAENYSRSK